MLDKYLLLVADENSGHWSVIAQRSERADIDKVVEELKDQNDPSPRLIIFTGDYVHD